MGVIINDFEVIAASEEESETEDVPEDDTDEQCEEAIPSGSAEFQEMLRREAERALRIWAH